MSELKDRAQEMDVEKMLWTVLVERDYLEDLSDLSPA